MEGSAKNNVEKMRKKLKSWSGREGVLGEGRGSRRKCRAKWPGGLKSKSVCAEKYIGAHKVEKLQTKKTKVAHEK